MNRVVLIVLSMFMSIGAHAKINWLEVGIDDLNPKILAQGKPYAILNALRAGHTTDVIKHLIDYGFDINQGDYKHRPPICVAARSYKGSTYMVEFLIKNGANPLATDINNTNALHRIAKYNPDPVLAKIFLNKGVNPTQLNKFGQTPVSLAKKYAPHLLDLYKQY